MSHSNRGPRFLPVALALASAILVSGATPAQIPQTFTNLQVLPAHVERGELIGMMRGFAGALHVRCLYCHVGDNEDLTGADFASDDKETKRVAREMMRMVKAINGEYLPKIGRDPAKLLQVECFTCHHGIPKPQPLQMILKEVLEASGPEAAVQRYRELREEHYGSSAYDFGPGPLNMLGEHLTRSGKAEQAIPILELDVELNPDAAWTVYLLADAHNAAGHREAAIAGFQKTLELDPTLTWARRKLDALLAPPPPAEPPQPH